MKRLIIIFAIAIYSIPSGFSQGMEEGSGFLSLGIGPSNTYVSYRTSISPALRVSFDKGFREIGPGVLTMGAMAGSFTRTYSSNFYSPKYQTTYHYKWRWTYLVAAFRLGYYYNFEDLDVKELNVYGGLSAGPRVSLFTDSYDGPDDSEYNPYDNSYFGFHFGSFLGANYFLTPKTAVFTEFGYDISWFTLGVTFNM